MTFDSRCDYNGGVPLTDWRTVKLIDKLNGTEYSIGDIIRDDYGTDWFVLGWSSYGWVQVIENDKLAEVASKFQVGTLALRLEFDNV